ncbi:MAG: DNA alkylation repair protein [Clostridia bacterium]|nr:DNA alkylation repair protein [Clostridia bacterium]
MSEIYAKIDEKYIKNWLKTLKRAVSAEDYERHKRIINSNQEIIDIKMGDIRALAKELSKCDFKPYLSTAKASSKESEFYEETLIQGLLISSIKNLDEQLNEFSWWVKKIDNWSTCDSVCASLKILKRCKEKEKYFNFFYDISFSKEEFVSRFGIVTIMSVFLESQFLDKIIELCKRVKSDFYYVNMGLAWLISFLFMKFKNETYELFESNTLSKFVQNKAISKCRDSFQVSGEDKDRLINYRKK